MKTYVHGFLGLAVTLSIQASYAADSSREFLATKGSCGADKVELYFTPVERIIGTVGCMEDQIDSNDVYYSVQSINYGVVGTVREVVKHPDGSVSVTSSELDGTAMKDNTGEIQLNRVAAGEYKTFPLNSESLKGDFEFYARTEHWGTSVGILVTLAIADVTGPLTPLGNDQYAADHLDLSKANWSFGCTGGLPIGGDDVQVQTPTPNSNTAPQSAADCAPGLSWNGAECIITN
jgi:hypothetical protein